MLKGLATIVKGGICKTNVAYRPSPSLFYFPGLYSSPVYQIRSQNHSEIKEVKEETGDLGESLNPSLRYKRLYEIKQLLESNHEIIREEYYNLRKQKGVQSDYQEDEHKLHGSSKWDWYSYILKGLKPTCATQTQERQGIQGIHGGQQELKETPFSNSSGYSLFERYCPQTTAILSTLESKGYLMTDTPFAFTFYSALHPHGVIQAHTGPCNLRLRIHLPLSVPKPEVEKGLGLGVKTENDYNSMEDVKSSIPCGIRIGDEIRTWEEGKILIFDDCYEHEVWNLTNEERVLLLIDIWHPDLEEREIQAIKDMFAPTMERHKQKQEKVNK